MLVRKFGGTSVKDETAIKRVFNIIKNTKGKSVIVVSAFATITNSLVNIIEFLKIGKVNEAIQEADIILSKHIDTSVNLEILTNVKDFIFNSVDELKNFIRAIDVLGEVTPKSMDFILSKGELLSSRIIFEYFKQMDLNIEYVDSRDIIKTDSNYTAAELIDESEQVIINKFDKVFKEFDYAICGGFIASNQSGTTTTLGRGGSDYSAAIIAKYLKAGRLEIWTDVDGILTSDPRLIDNAKLVKKLSYSEASELAFFGAKVLHPKTIYPAVSNNIPVYVLNTFRPESTGTVILENTENVNFIKAIAFRRNTIVINVQSNRMLGAFGFLSKVFEIFKNNHTSVDLVTTSEVSISLTIDDKRNIDGIIKELSQFSKVEIFDEKAIISAIGEGIRNTAGIAARFFGALKGINISMVSLGASEVNLSIIVSENDLEDAVKSLHSEFFSTILDENIFEKLERN